MTLEVKIEKVDSSTHSVRIYAEYRRENGTWHRGNVTEDMVINTSGLPVHGVIYNSKRLVIEELND